MTPKTREDSEDCPHKNKNKKHDSQQNPVVEEWEGREEVAKRRKLKYDKIPP